MKIRGNGGLWRCLTLEQTSPGQESYRMETCFITRVHSQDVWTSTRNTFQRMFLRWFHDSYLKNGYLNTIFCISRLNIVWSPTPVTLRLTLFLIPCQLLPGDSTSTSSPTGWAWPGGRATSSPRGSITPIVGLWTSAHRPSWRRLTKWGSVSLTSVQRMTSGK